MVCNITRYMFGLVHTCRQNRKLMSIDEVLQLFTDKMQVRTRWQSVPDLVGFVLHWSTDKIGNLSTDDRVFCLHVCTKPYGAHFEHFVVTLLPQWQGDCIFPLFFGKQVNRTVNDFSHGNENLNKDFCHIDEDNVPFLWTWGNDRHIAHPVSFVFAQKTDKFQFAMNGMRTIHRQCSACLQSHPHICAFDLQTIHKQFVNCLVLMCD